MSDDQSPLIQSAMQTPPESPEAKSSLFAKTALLLVMLTLLLLAWQWLNTRQRFNEVEKSLSQKIKVFQALNQQSLMLAKQAEERSTQANARTVLLEEKLAESRDQQEVLQTLYDQLAENREATAVAEVEQLLTIANQQLQLANNVKSALLALQAADKRLEPLVLPRAIQLRSTLALEIEKLRALPQVDVMAMSAQLETLASLCSTLPLISERQPTLNLAAAEKVLIKTRPTNSLQKFAFAVWADIKNLVTVERIDKPEPPLLAPELAFYLRENLKLRFLMARIALLQHDEVSYSADIKSVQSSLNQYYDNKHPNALKALRLLKQLSDNKVGIELPQLTESIAAVNRYKLTLENTQ